jgi:teichoic acid transport system permease protein
MPEPADDSAEVKFASAAEAAERFGLHRVGARPPFWEYLRRTWIRRSFIATMARFRVLAQLAESRLGVLWLVLRPSFDALIYGAIFGMIQVNRPVDYGARVAIGVFFFSFFKQCFTDGAKSITGNRALVQSLSFPRLTLPVAKVVEHLYSFFPCLLILMVVVPVMGHHPRLRWLLIIPLLALFTLFNTGVALFAARLTVHFRDLAQFLPYIARILFFSSGVLFDVGRIFERFPLAITIYDWHPIYQVLQLARWCMMDISDVSLTYWWHFAIYAVVVFIGGLLFFWVKEERYGRF